LQPNVFRKQNRGNKKKKCKKNPGDAPIWSKYKYQSKSATKYGTKKRIKG